MPIDFGETYASPNHLVTDSNGALADAGTVTATITLPDLTTSNPTVNHPSLGTYTYDFNTTQAGRHLAVVSATGGVLGSFSKKWVDAFVVRPANPAIAISFLEAKTHLNEQGTLQDEEIRAYLEVATEICEGVLDGPMSVRSYTERVRNGGWLIKLLHTPIVSVASVTSIRTPSTTYVTADLDPDQEYGIVYLKNNTSFVNGPWTAVYTAGLTSLPARYTQAVKEQLWHMWVMQRGQLADITSPDLIDVADFESRSSFGLGFLIPRRVMELLESDQIPGVA